MDSKYQIGSVVFGNWIIERLIGNGSYGEVYEIGKDDFGEHYTAALKVITVPRDEKEAEALSSDGMTEEQSVEYLQSIVEDIVKEFAIMAKFKGTANIVSYEDHQVVRHSNSIGWDILIRMELLFPLTKLVLNDPFTYQSLGKLGIDICNALDLCEKQNIVHRDVKPENIFMSPYGDFKLGDFGVARTLERVTRGSVKGTYNYMAPEVYLGGAYGHNVDTYSLGLMMYKYLNNNRLPFLPLDRDLRHQDMEQALLRRINGETLPAPIAAPKKFAEIILKACAYNPSDRYSSAAEMRRDLEDLMPFLAAIPIACENVASSIIIPAPAAVAPQSEPVRSPSFVPSGNPAEYSAPAPTYENAKKKKKKWPLILAIVLLLLAGIIFAVIYLLNISGLFDKDEDGNQDIQKGIGIFTSSYTGISTFDTEAVSGDIPVFSFTDESFDVVTEELSVTEEDTSYEETTTEESVEESYSVEVLVPITTIESEEETSETTEPEETSSIPKENVFPDGSREVYSYDDDGNLVKVIKYDAGNSQISRIMYAYEDGKLNRIKEYNESDLLVKEKYTDDNGNTVTVTRDYDIYNNVVGGEERIADSKGVMRELYNLSKYLGRESGAVYDENGTKIITRQYHFTLGGHKDGYTDTDVKTGVSTRYNADGSLRVETTVDTTTSKAETTKKPVNTTARTTAQTTAKPVVTTAKTTAATTTAKTTAATTAATTEATTVSTTAPGPKVYYKEEKSVDGLRWVYKYREEADGEDVLLTTQSYRTFGGVEKLVTNVDNIGRYGTENMYDGTGKKTGSKTFNINAWGRRTLEIVYNANNAVVESIAFEYDSQGRITKETHKDPSGNVTKIVEKEYIVNPKKSRGYTIKESVYDGNNNLISSRVY